MTAERASRSSGLRAAGDVTAEGRERERGLTRAAEDEGTAPSVDVDVNVNVNQEHAADTTQLCLVATR